MPAPPALPLAAAAAALLLAGCAAPGPREAGAPGARSNSASAPSAAAAASAPTLPATLAAPGSPPPFAAVIKDARRIDGPLTLWQKDDKVWIELTPEQLGKPFLLSPKLKSGLGEQWIVGGLMAYPVAGAGGSQVVEFVRVHNQVRLLSRNLEVTAHAGTPEARAVEASYSNSLLGSTPVASAPQPETKAVLIEANSIFLSDLLGVGMTLQRTFRQGYGLDRGNSVITAVRSSKDVTVIETLNHYYTGSIATPGPGQAGPAPSVPRYLPDARSLMIGHHYSLMPLPAEPMPARRADPRVGLFTTTRLDFSDDLARTPRQRFIARWRLEKKDPAAELSEPVKPITFWIDRNVPVAYRETVKEAILEWNKAFAKIGFKDALVVRQQAEDDTFDTLDGGVASVRWMMSAEPSFSAIGPVHVDPRTGEILDADIGVEGMSLRWRRSERTQFLGAAARLPDGTPDLLAAAYAPPPGWPQGQAWCAYGEAAAEQLAYGLDVLAARDELEPDSPEAQRFVLDYVKETVMHEVGHALGLRHNFRASRIYSEAQLADPEFTREHGTTGSVMEYNAINLARPGERGGQPFQTTLGPYDYWAIEYAYKPLPQAAEAAELQRIAARNSDPLLAYGTDEDNSFGLDPETVQLDLGSDPIAFASKRLAIARDLFRRQETRVLPPDHDYAVLRRSIGYALGDVGRSVSLLLRQIGGVRTLRDYPGSGRDPLQPVDAATQRAALDEIVNAVLAADGLTLSPALQRRLAPDFLDRGEFGVPADYSLPQRLLDLQRAVLATLMSDGLAARVLDSNDKFDQPSQAMPLAEIYGRLTREVWSELGRGDSVAPARRELQREHVNRLAASLLSPPARADARALLREQASALLAQLEGVLRQPGRRDAETRAHLQQSAETLRQAMAARLPRTGV
ncbi:MAG: zinc-dependent metalloprotease [Rubrivivax sp.]